MRRSGTIVAALALAGIASAPAAAQQVTVGFGGDRPSLETTVPVRVTGQLTVQFHGDTAAGCARWGLCGYSGTVSWRPALAASLLVNRTLGRHASTTVTFLPSFLPGPGQPGGVTTADVALDAATPLPSGSHCVDAASTGAFLPFVVRAGRVGVSLVGATPSLLVTRCAGPRDPDVIPELPVRSLSVAALKRGRTAISLATSHPLSAHGFSGSVSSTIVLRLGAPGRTTRSSQTSGSPPGATTRVRRIDVGYRATISGSVAEQVRGAANPLLCAPLGSCRLTGTITLTPRPESAHATLTAQELASRPRRTLLAAVGLSPGPAPGVTGFGAVQWSHGGSMTVDLTQGPERCDDAVKLGSGALLLATSRGRLAVSYVPGALVGGPQATRCPGPLPADAPVAAGGVPVSMLGRRTTRIRLTTGFTAADDGYAMRFVPDLTLTLTPVTRRTSIVTLPAGASPLERRQTR
jgi:hypothetical protein